MQALDPTEGAAAAGRLRRGPLSSHAPVSFALRSLRALVPVVLLVAGLALRGQEPAMVLGVNDKADARGQFAHSNLITVLNSAGEVAHRRSSLQGEVSTAARTVVLAAQ